MLEQADPSVLRNRIRLLQFCSRSALLLGTVCKPFMATLLYATRSAPGGAREDVQRKGVQALACMCALLSSSADMLTVIEGGACKTSCR